MEVEDQKKFVLIKESEEEESNESFVIDLDDELGGNNEDIL